MKENVDLAWRETLFFIFDFINELRSWFSMQNLLAFTCIIIFTALIINWTSANVLNNSTKNKTNYKFLISVVILNNRKHSEIQMPYNKCCITIDFRTSRYQLKISLWKGEKKEKKLITEVQLKQFKKCNLSLF